MSYKANPREIRALVNLAQESLESAKLRLDENFFRGSVSDSYYAAFYITKAALLNNDIITKTHSGTQRKFGENFVKTGMVDKSYGQWLSKALEERTEADYDALVEFTHEEAKEAYEKTVEFVSEVKKLVQ